MVQPEKDQEHRVAVLFSGGRDSSLATCLLAQKGARIHLLTTFNGATINGDISKYRYRELRKVFPNHVETRVTLPTFGLFRRIALANIEQDFSLYKSNLIPLGDALASHTEAIVYCAKKHIGILASGYTQYESNFPEQTSEAIELTRGFAAEYGIDYSTPIIAYTSADEVKYRLLDFGISTKSLEGISIFSDTYSEPAVETVIQYIKQKLPICREYIALKLSTD